MFGSLEGSVNSEISPEMVEAATDVIRTWDHLLESPQQIAMRALRAALYLTAQTSAVPCELASCEQSDEQSLGVLLQTF